MCHDCTRIRSGLAWSITIVFSSTGVLTTVNRDYTCLFNANDRACQHPARSTSLKADVVPTPHSGSGPYGTCRGVVRLSAQDQATLVFTFKGQQWAIVVYMLWIQSWSNLVFNDWHKFALGHEHVDLTRIMGNLWIELDIRKCNYRVRTYIWKVKPPQAQNGKS